MVHLGSVYRCSCALSFLVERISKGQGGVPAARIQLRECLLARIFRKGLVDGLVGALFLVELNSWFELVWVVWICGDPCSFKRPGTRGLAPG